MQRGDDLWPEGLSRCIGTAAPTEIYVRGNLDILGEPKVAIFSSRRCPGTAILRTYDLARALRDAGACVIGGFHSSIKKECLDLLLPGEAPVIVCPARTITPYRIRGTWRKQIEAGRMLLMSPFASHHRQTTALACKRNNFVAALADLIVIASADPGGNTEDMVRQALAWNKKLLTFDFAENANLIEMGVDAMDIEDMVATVKNSRHDSTQTP